MMHNRGILWFLVVFMVVSCKQSADKQPFLPSSTGGVNSLVVVMEDDLWQGEVGERVREQFARPALVFMPPQPILSLRQIPPQVFRGAITHSRSVLYVQEDTLSISHVKTNVYARPQKVAVVKGSNYEELVANIDSVAPKAIASYRAVELKEAQKRFTRSLNIEKALEEEFGIQMNIPSAYKMGSREENFVWFSRLIPKGNMNIIAYSMPEDSFANDSTFVHDIVRMRDSIGKKYIPGEYEGTYMMTEKAFLPYVFGAEIGEKKAAEVIGIWEINGYPMAGPFLTYIINDKENNRKMVIEGFAFVPNTPKRDYMFELEAILRTVNWGDQ